MLRTTFHKCSYLTHPSQSSLITARGLSNVHSAPDFKENRSVNNALQMFDKALKSVQPANMLSESLKVSNGELIISKKHRFRINKNVHLMGFGKASLGMVTTVLNILKKHIVDSVVSCPEPKDAKEAPPSVNLRGTVNMVYYGPSTNESNEQVLEASVAMAEMAERLTEKDLLLVCITGGGSALTCLPRLGLAPKDVWTTTKLLSQAGATIFQLNAVRSQLEVLKAGGLARLAAPAQTVSLILSDVIGDPLPVIASGPTVSVVDPLPNPMDIFNELGITDSIPSSVTRWLEKTLNKSSSLSDPSAISISSEPNFREKWIWNESHFKCPAPVNIIIGNNRAALNAAKETALQEMGFRNAIILTDSLQGDAGERGEQIANLIHGIRTYLIHKRGANRFQTGVEVMNNVKHWLKTWPIEDSVFEQIQCALEHEQDSRHPLCLLVGGETTVRVPPECRKSALGGRCTHMALATAFHLDRISSATSSPEQSDVSDIVFRGVFGASDGLDGPTDGAGAWIDAELPQLARQGNIDMYSYIKNYDSYRFFRELASGRYVINTGLTGTNVMDILIFTFQHNI